MILFICLGAVFFSSKTNATSFIDYSVLRSTEEISETHYNRLETKSSKFKKVRKFEFSTENASKLSDEKSLSFEAPNSADPIIDSYKERALSLNNYVEEQQRFVDQLDETTILDLPVGIKKTIGNIIYTIVIDSIVMLPTRSYLTAYMAFEIPSNGKKLAFRGTNIEFSKNGGLSGVSRLELLGDHQIGMGPNSLLIFKGEGLTYVEWDCFGFKSFGLDAEIEFSRNMLKPDTENGTPGPGNVRGRFTAVNLTSWDALVAEVNMEPFQVNGLDGVGFEVKKAVLDYSSINQAPGVVYPSGYNGDAFDPGNPNFWQGIFISEVSVKLPKQFNEEDSNNRIGFAGYNLIIDDSGFSGVLEATNVLGNGTMDKWPFTVNNIRIELISNQISAAGFDGLITLPVDKENPFEYSAIINPGNEYLFAVSPSKDLQFEFLKTSEVILRESSFLEVSVKNQKFMPRAYLNGSLSISSGEAKLNSLDFEALQLQTVEPYVQLGAFTLGTEGVKQNLGAFEIALNRIGSKLMDDPNEIGIVFDVTVKVIGEDGGGIGATGGIVVVGSTNSDGKRFSYERLEISRLGIAMNIGPVAVDGTLEWFKNDNTYGDGIRGEATVLVMDEFEVQAVLLFGKRGTNRFWFFDALAPNIPPSGTGIDITSFGGGAYYHMRQSMDGAGSYLGESLSGIVYVPDPTVNLGLKATVYLATSGSDGLFNGDATLEITFNSGGGVRMIDFKGNGYFLTPSITPNVAGLKDKVGGLVAGAAQGAMDQLNPDAMIAAHIHINYDVPNKTLHGNFEVFVEVIGGTMKGIGQNNIAGWVVIHFEPGEWYIHAGSPDDPLGLEMIKILKTKSYLMMGDYIPASPPPPERVSQILGGMDLDYMADLNELASGRGVAFGSRVEFDTGDITFLMFYARLAAGLGFDIMLKDYGNASCVGSSGPIGINGWYANGQAFGYFDGAIGIKVKILGKRKKINILSLAAAVVMQAKLPNPIWIRGVVGGRFSVLGGLVKGDCKFEVTIGDNCQIEGGSVLEGIQVISEITPNEGANDVSVFNVSQGVFNMEVGKVFEMVDLDDIKKSFRIKMDHFKILDGNQEIPGKLEWNYTNDVVAFNPIEILPPKKKLKAVLQVSFEEKVNGIWKVVEVDGSKFTEAKQVEFTTGEAPDYIPFENVEYSYPVISQRNFYKDESYQGYIKLKVGQAYLFDESGEWDQKGRIVASNGSPKYFEVSYTTQNVNYTIPKGLATNTTYSFDIVNVPKTASASIDDNISTKTSKVDLGDQQSTLEVETKEAQGEVNILQEDAIYGSFFRTSAYPTFIAKINSLSLNNGWSWPVRTGIHELGVNMSGPELFSYYEMNGFKEVDPLIELEATLGNNYWYQNYIKSLIYPSYPAYGLSLTWRQADKLGAPPAKAIYIEQNLALEALPLTDAFSAANPTTSGSGVFLYDLPLTMYKDYSDYRYQMAQDLLEGNNSWFSTLANTPFPGIRSGDYKMRIKYKLPGKNIITSSKEINIHVD
ncbi:hypothetical protein [Fulvivirga lutea]|uniref:Uncharacterized protein n=1 Tax=Fulvivirga lutea TaxID=2810512 RepID=A0A974WIE0_9BACT|nr:hypothetical protein [Fulvivirga lutea]QSE98715.1 hypothetical protein JR347_06440 [Fulvivirga lutea]